MIREQNRRAVVVFNPVAGGAGLARLQRALDRHLTPAGWTYELLHARPGASIAAHLRQVCAAGVGMALAAGGDGTVAAVAAGLVGGEVPLGILPLGTGNGLARGLGLPLSLDKAAQLLVDDPRIRAMDALRFGERLALLNVSAGITSEAVRQMYPEEKRRLGILAYFVQMLPRMLGLQPRRFQLQVDEATYEVAASEILISNGEILGEPLLPFGPPDTFFDAQIRVYVLYARGPLDVARALLRLATRGRIGARELTTLYAARRVRVDSSGQPYPIQADGDPIGWTPVEVELLPAAVRVLLPRRRESGEWLRPFQGKNPFEMILDHWR